MNTYTFDERNKGESLVPVKLHEYIYSVVKGASGGKRLVPVNMVKETCQ